MTPEDIEKYAEYCIQDTRLCKQMGEHFDKFTPPLEARLIDMTIRMFTEPALVGDIDMMQHLYETEAHGRKACWRWPTRQVGTDVGQQVC